MRSTSGSTAANLDALQTIWVIAFDDDDVADYLQRLAVLLLMRYFLWPLENRYPIERRVLLARLHGDLRGEMIRQEAEICKRLDEYSKRVSEPDDSIPF